MKTQTKASNHAMQYILDSIEWDRYDTEDTKRYQLDTDEGKLRWLYDTFKVEYGHAIGRYGERGAFREWLMGLPSVLPIAFMNSVYLCVTIQTIKSLAKYLN